MNLGLNNGHCGRSPVWQYVLVTGDRVTVLRSVGDVPRCISVGRRVVVTGLAGSGKSTFSRALSARTGLPVVHLDVHFWQSGWVEPSETEWREKQRALTLDEDWILDGNYHETLDLRLQRADTAILLDTRWWVCVWRAIVRGVRRRPAGFQLPEGCDESAWRRLRDEWSLAGRIWRVHRAERDRELEILSQHTNRVSLYVLRTKRVANAFVSAA